MILITNDDGIHAEGLARLAEEAVKYDEVIAVAPDRERSAISHGISLREPLDVFPCSFPVDGVKAYSCSGSPADCVRVAIHGVLPKKPDVVLAGVNRGYNLATDVQYSGTVAAAFEGEFQGCMSIALSEDDSDCHEVRDAYLGKVLGMLLGRNPGYKSIFNVNFPACRLRECRGILENRINSGFVVYRDRYDRIADLPGGGARYMINGIYSDRAEEESDYRAVLDNHISIGILMNIH